MMQALFQRFDQLAQQYATGDYHDEVIAARLEHEKKAGRVFEDDDLYEARTTAFLEWYITERPLEDVGRSPAAVAYADSQDENDRAWLHSHRGLFEVTRIKKGMLALVDLLGDGHFEIHDRRTFRGVETGDIFEGRLLPTDDGMIFGKTFLFHPPIAKKSMMNRANSVLEKGGSRHDAIDRLAALRVQGDRYRNLCISQAYELNVNDAA